MKLGNEQNKGIFNSVFLGYFVLLLHVLLIFALGVAVILLKGVYDFRWLLFIGGVFLIGGSGYLLYKRLKQGNRRISDMMNDPALRDRTLEVSLLGGMASVKLGHRRDPPRMIDATDVSDIRQLVEAPGQVKELGRLVRMLEDDLITREEFRRLKKELIEK